ncbi:hypothetical protein TIFTF001_052397 [Ficus carica]|uniref:Uncharacterized protein n=1 Tax=Ficus carica TaxID=3494 RepID=A0AA88EH61_FICCA|nr:hypothetical protein TIFTF001_052397 [Ficus carica]
MMNPNSEHLLVVFLVLAAASMNICSTHGRKLLEDNVLSGNQVAIPILSHGDQTNYATSDGGHYDHESPGNGYNLLSGNQVAIPVLSHGDQSNYATSGAEHNIVSGNQVAIPVLSHGDQSNYVTSGEGHYYQSPGKGNNLLSGNQVAIPVLSHGDQSNYAMSGGEHNIVSGNQVAIPVLSKAPQRKVWGGLHGGDNIGCIRLHLKLGEAQFLSELQAFTKGNTFSHEGVKLPSIALANAPQTAHTPIITNHNSDTDTYSIGPTLK